MLDLEPNTRLLYPLTKALLASDYWRRIHRLHRWQGSRCHRSPAFRDPPDPRELVVGKHRILIESYGDTISPAGTRPPGSYQRDNGKHRCTNTVAWSGGTKWLGICISLIGEPSWNRPELPEDSLRRARDSGHPIYGSGQHCLGHPRPELTTDPLCRGPKGPSALAGSEKRTYHPPPYIWWVVPILTLLTFGRWRNHPQCGQEPSPPNCGSWKNTGIHLPAKPGPSLRVRGKVLSEIFSRINRGRPEEPLGSQWGACGWNRHQYTQHRILIRQFWVGEQYFNKN